MINEFKNFFFLHPVKPAELIPAVLAFITALFLVPRLFVEGAVKSRFDRELERLKTVLDLQKQQTLKDFGLFAERKHELNREVYAKLRTAYRSLNKAIRGAVTHHDVSLLTPSQLEEFLAPYSIDLLDRMRLVRLQEIAPEVASREIIRKHATVSS
jgi:hypothetical protein